MLFIFGMGLFGSTFLLPLYLQNSLDYTAFQAGIVFFPIGIIQAIISPIAGWMTDKVNPKIPSLIGITLTALSLYLYSFFSLTTEHGQIMLPLYLRGFGMGLIFIPLTTISLLDIPREKMAQASGLLNTIRQIGGSFGVALLGSLLTRRVIFHTQAYGQVVNTSSSTYQNIFYNLQHFVQHSVGGATNEVTRARSRF